MRCERSFQQGYHTIGRHYYISFLNSESEVPICKWDLVWAKYQGLLNKGTATPLFWQNCAILDWTLTAFSCYKEKNRAYIDGSTEAQKQGERYVGPLFTRRNFDALINETMAPFDKENQGKVSGALSLK